MKYKAFQNFSNYDIYRDCVLVDLNKNLIGVKVNGINEIVDPKKLPEGVICCDPNMASIVLLLNKKGYKTLYSCGGHFDENIDGTEDSHLVAPYIIFEPDNIEEFASYLLTLPNQFSLLIDSRVLPTAKDEMESAYGDKKLIKRRRISIYSNIVYGYNDDNKDKYVDLDIITREIFEKYNTKDIEDLLSWVNTLPDLNKPKLEMSNALYDERVIDHNTAKQCGFDFESVQEYAEDIKESYNIAADSIKEINEQMAVISDMVTHIGKRLAAMKVVDDIRTAKDDTSSIII